MYTIIAIIVPVLVLHYGNHFYSVKTKIGQLPAPGAELVPVHI